MTGSSRILAVCLSGLRLGAADQTHSSAVRNTGSEVHYTGSQACAACHPAIFSSYRKTAMGRSMAAGNDPSVPDRFPAPFTIFDNEAGQYFEVIRKPDGLYEGQYAVDPNGKEVFRQTMKLDYVVGSGENGFGFLVQRGRYLFEAPLTFYSKPRMWSFSPGYEQRNWAFTRPVIAECVGCHAGRPQPVPNRVALYRDPPFAELSIGCENCHGPGELHIAERRSGRPPSGTMDTSIVNPARLSGWPADNICMKCHQGGDLRVELPGKRTEDFRPGTSLNQVLAIFKVPLKPDTPPQSVLLEHYFSMTLSKCFRSSAGKLRCTSCHDPHAQPSPLEAATYYRDKCASCHRRASCTLSAEDRNKTNPPDNCVSCHMPKRTVATITHAALTDHRIVARPGESYPQEAFESGADADSGLLLLTSPPGRESLRVPTLTLFQAYVSLVKGGHTEFTFRANELLDRLARESAGDPIVLSALARRSMAKDTPAARLEAIHYFTGALRIGSRAREDFLLLAELYGREGENNQAIEVLQKGMRANPYMREFSESLALRYMAMGQYREALGTIRKGQELFPDDVTLRVLEKRVKAATLDETVVH